MRISMLRTPLLLGAAATLALTSIGSTSTAAAVEPSRVAPRYQLVDLGTLGGESSYATAMNDRGAVVGRAQTGDGTYHGFLWRRGQMVDLGLFSPVDINNKGQVVGGRDDMGGAYLWSKGRLVSLTDRFRFPTAINDRGQVVGQLETGDGRNAAGLWSGGTVRTLPLNSASDINKRGQVAGGRLVDDGYHASVWRRGRVTDFGAAAFNRSNSYGINKWGWVIGWTFSDQQYERGALWRHGRRTDLGTLGGNATHAVAINDRGVILVTSATPNNEARPALWRRGVLTDLTGAGVSADADLAGYNNHGEIAASIRPADGVSHAALYRPTS